MTLIMQGTLAAPEVKPGDHASQPEQGDAHQHDDEEQDQKHVAQEEHADTDHDDPGSEHEEESAGHAEHDEHEEKKGGDHTDHEEPALSFSPDLLREFGAGVAVAESGVIRQHVVLPGEVQLNAEAVAHITPQFPARIVEVRARTGDAVEAGETLAVAESSETLARFELKSLIDGVVTKRHVTLGEHPSPDDTAFVVADLSTLWVDIALYPKQVPLVKVGQPVRISTSHGPAPVDAQVDYVAPQIDEKTRTGLARVFLPNENRNWKPGMFIKGDITLGEFPAPVVVPETAVIEVEDQPMVFVQEGDRWQPRPVKLGRRDSDSVEIVAGLDPGERYVAEGGFVLKAQLQKSEFESGHSH